MDREAGPALIARVTAIACVGLLAAPLGSEAQSHDLAHYLGVAARYRAGQRAGAVREIRRWPPEAVRAAVSELSNGHDRVRQTASHTDEIGLDVVEAAALMHAEAGLQALERQQGREAERQLAVAGYLAEWTWFVAAFRDEQRKKAQIAPRLEPRCRPRDLYVALARSVLANGFPIDAADFARRALEAAPGDPEASAIAGTIAETRALEAQVRGREKEAQGYRVHAERELRASLDAEPGSVEVRLRLGHVLLAQGRSSESEPLLRAAANQAETTRQRYLALLFLGRACERQDRPDEARSAYRGALEAWPASQAARLALASVLEPDTGPREARALVAASLADSARADREPDPWWSYPFGDQDAARAGLERLWREVLEP